MVAFCVGKWLEKNAVVANSSVRCGVNPHGEEYEGLHSSSLTHLLCHKQWFLKHELSFLVDARTISLKSLLLNQCLKNWALGVAVDRGPSRVSVHGYGFDKALFRTR